MPREPAPAPPIRAEDVCRLPPPGYSYPTGLRFGPGDRLLTFLASPEGGLRQALQAMDLSTGGVRTLLDPRDAGTDERSLPLEEQLRRERLRERSVGVTSYQWSERNGSEKDGAGRAARLLVPLRGALLVKDGADAPAREVVPAGGAAIEEPRLSPDGEWIGFVRDAELHVVPASGGTPRQVTHGARGTGRTHGLAEYVAQEEMHRHQGWWWSDDSAWIAFTEVDDTHVPLYRIPHAGKDEVVEEVHRYPFAGAANAKVRLGVVPRDGGEPVWMDLPPHEYLARVRWFPDGTLWAQVQDRSQRTLDLVRLDPRTGRATYVLRETSATWVNLNDALRPVPPCGAAPAGGFLWMSERTGFQHLFLHDLAGKLLRQVTSGEWMVDAVAGLDAERGLVWFTGTKDGATERHLYEVPLAGGAIRRVTPEPGMHDVLLDGARRTFVDVHSTLDAPPAVRVRSLADGSTLHTLHDVRDPRIAALGLRPPELVTIPSRDGVPLHAAVWRPGPEHGKGPFPTVVMVYGGPHVQRVQRSWDQGGVMRAHWYRSLGFLVLALDNRGSARRGVAFEAALHRNMGDVEVRDQVDGVRWAVAKGLADPARVGVVGWSYGGYMAAMCLARAPETFRAACAGAPVTHWDGYDTHYTERYMGTPGDNAEGYRVSSVMHHVAGIRGALLLVHGMLDENVHFRHTARLVNALNRAHKRYEILLYPDERHMPRGEADRVHMEERIREFFARELRPGA